MTTAVNIAREFFRLATPIPRLKRTILKQS